MIYSTLDYTTYLRCTYGLWIGTTYFRCRHGLFSRPHTLNVGKDDKKDRMQNLVTLFLRDLFLFRSELFRNYPFKYHGAYFALCITLVS